MSKLKDLNTEELQQLLDLLTRAESSASNVVVRDSFTRASNMVRIQLHRATLQNEAEQAAMETNLELEH